jgi:hypothetical protein
VAKLDFAGTTHIHKAPPALVARGGAVSVLYGILLIWESSEERTHDHTNSFLIPAIFHLVIQPAPGAKIHPSCTMKKQRSSICQYRENLAKFPIGVKHTYT